MKEKNLIQKGFSLMELLVVISIIAILVAVGTISYTTAQKKGRDAKRKGDMRAVQNAMEQYYVENSNNYHSSCQESGGTISITVGGRTLTVRDPKNTGSYTYSGDYCDTDEYCYCATMEDDTQGNMGAGCSGGTDYFCVQNAQ